MPETACLHIQTRASDTVRVVDLPGGSIRIGRAAYCEVRLTDLSLADEECRLRLRRGQWELAPSANGRSVAIDGEGVRVPRPLAMDAAFTIGEFTLTLRRAPGFDAVRTEAVLTPGAVYQPLVVEAGAIGPAHRTELRTTLGENYRFPDAPASPKPMPESGLSSGQRTTASESERYSTQRADDQARLLHAQLETKRWERRWKAAGEKLRAASESSPPRTPSHSPRKPMATERPRPSMYPAAPLPDRPRIEPVKRHPTAPVAELLPKWREVAVAAPTSSDDSAAPQTPPVTVNTPPARFAESEDFARQIEAIDADSLDRNVAPEPVLVFDAELSGIDASLEETDATVILGSVRREEEPGVEVVAEVAAFFTANDEVVEAEFCDPAPVGVEVTEAIRDEAEATEEPELPAEPETIASAEMTVPEPQPVWPERRMSDQKEVVEAPARGSREWPTVNDILAAQGVRAQPRGARSRAKPAPTSEKRRRKTPYRPDPTVAREPGTWSMPLWLAAPPTVAAAVFLCAVGLVAGWTWTIDGYDSLIVAKRLADPTGTREPLPKGVRAPTGGWWKTSAASLVYWAMYEDRVAGDDPARLDDARKLLERAGNASPLHAAVLHANAEPPEGPPVSARVLGQTRDVAPLASAGRLLLASGKKAEALNAYRQALAMASLPDRSRRGALVFLDDSETMRYGLPGEDQIGPIVRELVKEKAWTYADWSSAVPSRAVPAVVVARTLRDRGGPDFQTALAFAIKHAEAPVASESAAESAVRLAAQAEALALQGRWTDARDVYRQAVTLTSADTFRRAWWLNLAMIALRLNEESDRQKALESAKNPDPNDEITQRVVEIQKKAGYAAQRSVARGTAAIAGQNPSAN